MEETLKLPEDPDTDVTFVFCDNCNPDWDPYQTMAAPKEWCEALGVPEGTVFLRGVVRGDTAGALAQGWTEEEYGHCCPVCVAQSKELDGEAALISNEEFMTALMEAAAKATKK